MAPETTTETQLVPAQPQTVKQELALKDPTTIQVAPEKERDLDAQAEDFVKALLDRTVEGELGSPTRVTADVGKRNEAKEAVENVGLDLQRQAAAQSEMLKQPISKLSKRGEDGGEVANSLIELKMQVEALDPNKLDFKAGWLSRTMGMLPGVGTPLKRYFTKYESGQTVIAAIIRSLENGRDQLGRDNITLSEDQKRMGEMCQKLEKAIKLGQLIDAKLQYKLDREAQPGTPEAKFIGEELLFPLRQRVIDLQQQLAVNQQGILAIELVVRNNKELIRGVNRALSVTVSALEVAVTVAMALENQKIVLDKLDAVNKTTSSLISGTAQRLRTQGVDIQKRASSASLDMESLKSAFNDLKGALEDLSNFRQNALPQMASTVLQLDQMSKQSGEVIRKLEQGKQQAPKLLLKID